MKRILLTALTASLLVLGVPGAALAAHHGKRHAACSAKAHRHHARCAHAHVRVLAFGPLGSAPASGTTPVSSPRAPSGPTETAGKITSFEAPVLTITLNDGTVVSGKVTEKTEIECESATPTGGEDEGDDDAGGSSGDEGSSGDGASHDARLASTNTSSEDGDGADSGDDDGARTSCTTSALVPGTVVRAAELVVGGEGAVWEKVDLVS
jgi:hypothetical protein